MEIKPGVLVRYTNNDNCIGVVIEIGETMAKVRWHDEDIVEWMPFYSLEIVNV